MKIHSLAIVATIGFFLFGCGKSLVDSRYKLDLPEIPESWETLLGKPHWRIEWVNVEGRKETQILSNDENVEIDLLPTWANAVSAYPFWPEIDITPGIFRPAGAIFPFDVSGKTLVLSWKGGVDAALYWELAASAEDNASEPEMERAAIPRLPWNFDWPRFRQLFVDSSLNAEFLADPWLADWRSIAEKIVKSGFDKRRLVPETRSSLQVSVGPGPWIGTSPFAAPLFFETAPAFPVRAAADTWISAEGLLRCNTGAWIMVEWEK
jgi:hypothetical protein